MKSLPELPGSMALAGDFLDDRVSGPGTQLSLAV